MEPDTAATHDEIWEDSALVESWNQALEEYKKYHSIHARGGTVDDIVPNGQDDEKTLQNAKPGTGDTGEQPMAPEEDEAEDSVPMDESDEKSYPTISDAQNSVDAKKDDGPVAAGGPPALGPQTLLGTIQDEELKKLLMSWYYAGYYTGLYEGKQQGLQQAEQLRKSS
ncbi:hypothetical protein N656DRAFT_385438 [Canariomyces notabilis]|uniref:Survival motor neuron Tudor domain-containing protein n=1 Tax=Canariomyces notabilis TaxID=2074819 RepID=A0AAN6TJC1_9PEZI|nr:hypothetical protein N656DRAFT_385438 [Canariomyces arenarius]